LAIIAAMRTVLAAFLLALASPLSAGRLDLDYPAPKPDPTVTLVHGLFLPGMAWFHVASHTADHGNAQRAQGIGVAFAAATALSMWVMVNNAVKGDTQGLGLGLGLTIALRYADLWGAVTRAHIARYDNRMGGEGVESRPSRRAEPQREEPEAGFQPEPERVEPEPVREPAPARKSKSILPVWLE